MTSVQQWNPDSYDQHLAFVSKFGQGIMEWLNPQAGERILDLGCGTGDLSAVLAEKGANVSGIDYSAEMIAKAKEKYPTIPFSVEDGQNFTVNEPFDAVFSNAALHWMKSNPSGVIESVWNSLRSGGRFAAEFGGKDNVEAIVRAISEVLPKYGIDAEPLNPWYFPSIGEYCSLLEQQGFHVRSAELFSRPTELPDGDKGLLHWLSQFGDAFFHTLNNSDKEQVMQNINRLFREQQQLQAEENAVADYYRIRVLAFKP
ncbi:class I SAM-dependent methyltransferase [Paenibacillus sp. NPDC058174]|uniref:class I SAM-dependent methyltransferase n=1 Tax=Paenibacillus sp. NPDC058174 TaxID=3346366 RepID=UPI0036DBF48B